MTGSKIPLQTEYIITASGTKTRKVPLYVLKSKEEMKAIQDELGKYASWYYGTNCEKCHDVYPMIVSEQSNRAYAYYVCPVCGKESFHFPMPWQSAKSWNNQEYLWKPDPEDGYQFTIFDFLRKEETR